MNRDIGSTWNSEWGAVGVLGRVFRGGRHIVLAGAERGMFASEDGGVHWHTVATGEEQRAVTSLSGPPFSGCFYAGSENGVWRLDESSDSWSRLLKANVHAIVVAGTGLEGDCLIAGTEHDGVIRSEDGGHTWRSATAGMLDSTVLALASSPPDAPERFVLAGTPSSVYVSRNDGKAWRTATLPDERNEVSVQCLAVSPEWNGDAVAFAGTEDAGLMQSTDRGLTWQSVAHFGDRSVTAIAHAFSRRWIVSAGREIDISHDAGKSWRRLAESTQDVWSLLVDEASADSAVLAGLTNDGVARFALDE